MVSREKLKTITSSLSSIRLDGLKKSRSHLKSIQSSLSSIRVNELKKYRSMIKEMNRKKLQRDMRDRSCNPSYSQFQLPYYLRCRDRYHLNRAIYEHQFQHEIRQLMKQQSSAYEEARFMRHLCITTLWPPLHNHEEVIATRHLFFQLTPKEKRRLRQLMSPDFQ